MSGGGFALPDLHIERRPGKRSATGQVLLDENMRVETRQILRNQRAIFANADPGRLIVNKPAADQRIAVAKLRQLIKRLATIIPSSPYGPSTASSVLPFSIIETFAPSREKIGLTTYFSIGGKSSSAK